MCLLISCKCGIISKVRDKSLFLSEGNNMKDIKVKLNITNDYKQEKKICDNICQIHKEKFIAYCKECDKDICQKCIDLKTEHKLILLYANIIPSSEEFIKKYNEIETSSDNLIKFLLRLNCGFNYHINEIQKIREMLRRFYFNFSKRKNELNFALIYNVKANYEFNLFNLDILKNMKQNQINKLSILKNNGFNDYDYLELDSKKYSKLNIKNMIINASTDIKININDYFYIQDYSRNVIKFMILNLLNY